MRADSSIFNTTISSPASVQSMTTPTGEHFVATPTFRCFALSKITTTRRRKAVKTAIFRERTIHQTKIAQAAETPQDALVLTLNEMGRVDFARMEMLLSRPPEEFIPELKGMVYRNPQTERWETEDQYLSGDVRAKLEDARAAATANPAYQENVTALEAVQPADLSASEIDARLGAVWIPPADVEAFAKSLLGAEGITVSHAAAVGTWFIKGDYGARATVANTTEWGTTRYSALELIQDALNLKTPTVYDTDPKTDARVINAQQTEGARDKMEKIKERFKGWIWEEDERRERLCRKYNDEFNSVRLRVFNGSHLTLPSSSQQIQLNPHQKNGVWRIVQSDNTLLAHVVGGGKTYTMVAAGIELKRLGLATKPMFVVPNHMLGQFSTEMLMLYPTANILVARKEDFEASKRARLFSRIATGNWDAVIVTHASFEKIPVSVETRREFIAEQIHEIKQAIREQRSERGTRLVKGIGARAKAAYGQAGEPFSRAQKGQHADIRGAWHRPPFHRRGAQVQKPFLRHEDDARCRVAADRIRTRVRYVPQGSAHPGEEQRGRRRFRDRHADFQHDGGNVHDAALLANERTAPQSLAAFRFVGGDVRRDCDHDGTQSRRQRLSPAKPLRPLRECAGVDAAIPSGRRRADGGNAQAARAEAGAGKARYRQRADDAGAETVRRSTREADGKDQERPVDPRDDNMLKITTEGRKAALDLRLMLPHVRDNPDSKTNQAVEKIHQIWLDSTPQKGAQLVFCDMSTPQPGGRGFSVYDDVRDKLLARGIPAAEIAFIQDFDDDTAKASLFKAVREGKVRVLLGSTAKMGEGTNVQKRLVALHHLDAPWRPADIEQREGRIIRQGNQNEYVKIFRYVTEGSFDAYMWQTLETKCRFIAQVMNGDATVRRAEDVDAAALTYAEVKAIASGNPLVIEKAQVDAEVMRLTRLKKQHAESLYQMRYRIKSLGRKRTDGRARHREHPRRLAHTHQHTR
jgi:hypothetical protein